MVYWPTAYRGQQLHQPITYTTYREIGLLLSGPPCSLTIPEKERTLSQVGHEIILRPHVALRTKKLDSPVLEIVVKFSLWLVDPNSIPCQFVQKIAKVAFSNSRLALSIRVMPRMEYQTEFTQPGFKMSWCYIIIANKRWSKTFVANLYLKAIASMKCVANSEQCIPKFKNIFRKRF